MAAGQGRTSTASDRATGGPRPYAIVDRGGGPNRRRAMYHEFYGLTRMPFQGSPDPDFLYPGPTHREALAALEYGVEAGMGFVLITGEVGLGKTTLIRTFLKRAQRPALFPIYVFHPLLTFHDLLAVMAEELEIPVVTP